MVFTCLEWDFTLKILFSYTNKILNSIFACFEIIEIELKLNWIIELNWKNSIFLALLILVIITYFISLSVASNVLFPILLHKLYTG